MDDFSFDDLTRSLVMPSRRTLLLAFASVFTGLVATNKDAVARAKRRNGKSKAKHQGKAKGKDHGRHKGKDHGKHKDKNQGKRKVKDEGRPKGKSKAKSPQSQQPPAAPAAVAAAGARCFPGSGDCTPGPGKNLEQCDYDNRELIGTDFSFPNLSRANFRRANLTGANLSGANLKGACFVDATMNEAHTGGAILDEAVFCRTIMPDGTTDNSGCGRGTACCPTCDDTNPCAEANQICCVHSCKTGDCCTNAECLDPTRPFCRSNTCSPCNGKGQCERGRDCCNGICCPDGATCVNDSCQGGCTPDTCLNGCCDASGVCQQQSNTQCGIGGVACTDCTLLDTTCANVICTTETGVCDPTPIKIGESCGDGQSSGICCGGRCEAGAKCCTDAQCEPPAPVCNANGQCVTCDDVSDCPVLTCRTAVDCLPDGSCQYADQDPGRACAIGDQSGICCGGGCNVGAECCTKAQCPCDGCGTDERICTAAGQCVACDTATDCTNPAAPICTADNVCVECASDGHCDGPGCEACNLETNTCVFTCTRPDQPLCNGRGSCVACVTNPDCAETPKRPVCDPSTNTCVACVDRADCGSTSNECTHFVCTGNQCVETSDASGRLCQNDSGICCASGENLATCRIDNLANCEACGVACPDPEPPLSTACATATCNDTRCDFTFAALGTDCVVLGQGGGPGVCDGAGVCVECLATADCAGRNTVCADFTCNTSINICEPTPINGGGTCAVSAAEGICCAGECDTTDEACCVDGAPVTCGTDSRCCGGLTCVPDTTCCEAPGEPACEPGLTCCIDDCVDTNRDLDHCGDCDTVCQANAPACQSGRCVCPANTNNAPCGAGLTCCADGCRNLDTDTANCGECGVTCSGGTPVCNGSGNCACGDVCPSGCRYTSVQDAINAAAPDSTIRICAGTYTGLITIPKSLTLLGAGAGDTILHGGGAGTVVTVSTGVAVTLQDLTVTGGKASANGGGIHNSGNLSLIGVDVTGNTATTTSFGSGGGVVNAGTLSLSSVSVTGNAASSFGGGIYNSSGTATLEAGSSVMNNTANAGGGIYILTSGRVTLQTGSRVAGNTTGNYGGGIANNGGSLTLQSGSSVTGNKGGGGGGGIHNDGSGTTTLEAGSTVSGNTSIGTTQFSGGGIVNLRGTLTVEGSVSGNTAGSGGGIYNQSTLTLGAKGLVENNDSTNHGGGIYNLTSGTVTLQTGSRVVGNKCAGGGGGIANNGGRLTLQADSSVAGNQAGFWGGGIFSTSGEVTLEKGSTVSGNTASGFGTGLGGGIYNQLARLTVDGHVSGNTARVRGGGIYNGTGATLTLGANGRVEGNNTPTGGGIYNDGSGTATLETGSRVTANTVTHVNGGGGVYENAGTVNVADSLIVTLNTRGGLPDNCRPAGAVPNCDG